MLAENPQTRLTAATLAADLRLQGLDRFLTA